MASVSPYRAFDLRMLAVGATPASVRVVALETESKSRPQEYLSPHDIMSELKHRGGYKFDDGEAPVFYVNDSRDAKRPKEQQGARAKRTLPWSPSRCILVTTVNVLKFKSHRIARRLALSAVKDASYCGLSSVSGKHRLTIGLLDGREAEFRICNGHAARFLSDMLGRVGHLNQREIETAACTTPKRSAGQSRVDRSTKAKPEPGPRKARSFRVRHHWKGTWDLAIVRLDPTEITTLKQMKVIVPASPPAALPSSRSSPRRTSRPKSRPTSTSTRRPTNASAVVEEATIRSKRYENIAWVMLRSLTCVVIAYVDGEQTAYLTRRAPALKRALRSKIRDYSHQRRSTLFSRLYSDKAALEKRRGSPSPKGRPRFPSISEIPTAFPSPPAPESTPPPPPPAPTVSEPSTPSTSTSTSPTTPFVGGGMSSLAPPQPTPGPNKTTQSTTTQMKTPQIKRKKPQLDDRVGYSARKRNQKLPVATEDALRGFVVHVVLSAGSIAGQARSNFIQKTSRWKPPQMRQLPRAFARASEQITEIVIRLIRSLKAKSGGPTGTAPPPVSPARRTSARSQPGSPTAPLGTNATVPRRKPRNISIGGIPLQDIGDAPTAQETQSPIRPTTQGTEKNHTSPRPAQDAKDSSSPTPVSSGATSGGATSVDATREESGDKLELARSFAALLPREGDVRALREWAEVRHVIATEVQELLVLPLAPVVHRLVVAPTTGAGAAAWGREARVRDSLFRRQKRFLRPKPQSFFGIEQESPTRWSLAVLELSAFDRCVVPHRKLEVLLDTVHAIKTESYTVSVLFPPASHERSRTSPCMSLVGCSPPPPASHTRVNSAQGETKPRRHGHRRNRHSLSADDFFPIFLYVLVHTPIRTPYAWLKYIRDASTADALSGEAQYYLTMFEAGIEYVRNFSASEDDGKSQPKK